MIRKSLNRPHLKGEFLPSLKRTCFGVKKSTLLSVDKSFRCGRLIRVSNYTTNLNDFWTRTKKDNNSYEVVLPSRVSPPRKVPKHIQTPEYALTGAVSCRLKGIELKNKTQIECMKESCKLARKILVAASTVLQVGVKTDEVDRVVHEMCIKNNAYPSPLNYHGFPKSVCTSVNNVVCHGIPDSRQLREGDIVSIDVSVYLNGHHGDCAGTFGVGTVDQKGRHLMSLAKKCLESAVKICHPGQKFNAIGKVISKLASEANLKVIPAFCGHGIGSYFHGPPEILHYDNEEPGVMKEGMVFTIEPVISEGSDEIVILEDGWSAVTVDNSRAAQFEHTILITESGVEVLT